MSSAHHERPLRDRLRKRLGACPACGRGIRHARRTASEIGIEYHTLRRFLIGDRISRQALAAVDRYLAQGAATDAD